MDKKTEILKRACGDGCWLTVINTDYDTLVMQEGFEKPSIDLWNTTIAEVEAEYTAQAYARSRASEYPPITDYLDGVVKNDQAQIDAYIAACQAVKAKYPKV